jgi:hypothetical protein
MKEYTLLIPPAVVPGFFLSKGTADKNRGIADFKKGLDHTY